MPYFSRSSKKKLDTCHPYLVRLMEKVIEDFDFKVISGHRTAKEQQKLIKAGRSWTNKSKHLESPSLAVDIAPYPVDWDDHERFIYLAGWVMATAKKMGIKLRWGGDFSQDTQIKDERIRDLGHFELID